MVRGLKILVLWMLVSLTAASLAAAEEKDAAEKVGTTQLEEIVVTATRTEKDLSSAPGSVSVVNQKEIEKRNIQTIDEALNTLPGVFDRRATGLVDPIPYIQLRGMPGSQRTLLLLDGVAINDPFSGGQKDLVGVAPENVDRIEVVRGPFSSLYGGYAMGGVVNVLTKMPEKREITLKTGYGSSMPGTDGLDNMMRFYGSYGDKFLDNKLTTFISYGYRQTDGYATDFDLAGVAPPSGITGWSRTESATGSTRYLIGDKGDREWWDDSLTMKAKYDFCDTTNLSLSFTHATNQYEYVNQRSYLRDSSGNSVWSYPGVSESSFLAGKYGWEGITSSVRFNTEFSPLKVQVTAGVLDWLKSWNTVPGSTATVSGGAGTMTDTPLQAYNSEIQFTLPVMDRHILTFGTSIRHSDVDDIQHNLTDWRDKDSATTLIYEAAGQDIGYSIFMQDEIRLFDQLTAYVGFRQDWWTTYDGYANSVGAIGYPIDFGSRSASYFSPKGSLVYKVLESTTLRSSVGQAFRPPTIYELYATFTGSYGTLYKSNPNLEPETTTSWDFGVEQKLWKGAKIEVTYFENYIKNLIYSSATDATLTVYDKYNAGKATSKGVELAIEQNVAEWLKLFGTFTYTDSEITENSADPTSVGKKMTDTPDFMYSAGAYLKLGRFSGSFTGRYVGKQYSTGSNIDTVNGVFGSYDPFFVADLKISYAFTPLTSLSFSVNNILNEQYYMYRKQPGTTWFMELTKKF